MVSSTSALSGLTGVKVKVGDKLRLGTLVLYSWANEELINQEKDNTE